MPQNLDPLSQFRLDGRVAIVTGASSGLGVRFARVLHAVGAKVVIAARRADRLDALAAELPGALAVPTDGTKAADRENLVKRAEEHFGRIDILVNNAGIQHVAPVQDFPVEKWDAIIAINLSSAFHTTRLALPGMLTKGWGRIVNIASAHGLVASAQKSAYVAAKHGLVGFTKSIALETATTGVTVNAICPGWVLTPLVQKQVDALAAKDGVDNDEAKRRLLAEKQPSLQFTTPAELGALAVFLCSDAAINVRGQAWAMDGGWTAV